MAKLKSQHKVDARGRPAGGKTTGRGLVIHWQNGPLREGGRFRPRNGAFVEEVIEAALDRLRFYQSTEFACRENQTAIVGLECAIEALHRRTRDREARGVEGTHQQ